MLWSASSLLKGEVSKGFGLVMGTNSDFLLDVAGNIESKFKSEHHHFLCSILVNTTSKNWLNFMCHLNSFCVLLEGWISLCRTHGSDPSCLQRWGHLENGKDLPKVTMVLDLSWYLYRLGNVAASAAGGFDVPVPWLWILPCDVRWPMRCKQVWCQQRLQTGL